MKLTGEHPPEKTKQDLVDAEINCWALDLLLESTETLFKVVSPIRFVYRNKGKTYSIAIKEIETKKAEE